MRSRLSAMNAIAVTLTLAVYCGNVHAQRLASTWIHFGDEQQADQGADQVVPRPPVTDGNFVPPGASSTDPNCVINTARSQTLMARQAATDLSSPDKRLYVEYNGELFPLKGIVKVPQLDVSGAEVRVPLTAEESQQVEAEITRLKISKESLKTRSAELSKRRERLDKESTRLAGDETRLNKELRLRESQHADDVIRLQHEQRTEFAELSANIDELDELRVVGKRVYAPVRVDSQHQVSAQSNTFGNVVTAAAAPVNGTGPVLESSVEVVEKRGIDYRRPEFRLPAPADPNDLFYSPQTDPSATRLGLAPHLTRSVLGETLALENISTVARISPAFGGYFDTRTVATDVTTGNFDVTKISTVRLPQDGNTKFIGADSAVSVIAPTSVILDNQIQDALVTSMGESQVQFYLEGNNYQQLDELSLRHWYGRVWNKGTWSAVAGKTQSLFSTGGLAPASLSPSMVLVGASGLGTNATRKQFRIQQNFASEGEALAWGVGIEDSASTDFVLLPAAGTVLTRWPTFTGNIMFGGNRQTDVLQLAVLYRNLGAQLPSGSERFEEAWGLGLFTSQQIIDTGCNRGALFAGATGGRGIGNYINGVQNAAVISGNDLIALKGFGAYAGYKHDRIMFNHWQVSSNLAYGMSEQSTLPTMAKETSTYLHQFWANAYVRVNKQVAFGTEWQYGRRLTLNDGNGENHRIFFGVELTSKAPGKTTTAIANTRVLSERYSAETLTTSDRQLMNSAEIRSSRAHLQGL